MRISVNTSNKFSTFGSTQPNPNNLNANQYRYGFGGMEQDKQSSSYTTYFRQYDPRIARWKSTDPVTQPWQSPYTAFDNNPIFYTDPSGAIAIPNKRRGIAGGGGIGGIGGALAGSAQTALSLAIRGGMQASMVGTYMQSAILPTSSATNSGRELGVGNESGLANNLAANDLYACTTCPQPLNEPDLEFAYDALGNRVMKLEKPRTGTGLTNEVDWTYTYYAHDAAGNVMAVYEKKYEPVSGNDFIMNFSLSEHPIYAHKRIGMRLPGDPLLLSYLFESTSYTNEGYFDGVSVFQTPTPYVNEYAHYTDVMEHEQLLGSSEYELTNHLEHVLLTISDKKMGVAGSGVHKITESSYEGTDFPIFVTGNYSSLMSTNYVNTGTYAIRQTSSDTYGPRMRISVKPGDDVDVTIYGLRSAGCTGAQNAGSLKVDLYDCGTLVEPQADNLDYTYSGQQWHQLSVSYTVPSGGSQDQYIEVYTHVSSTQCETYFDDVVVDITQNTDIEEYYTADILSRQQYYPFGSTQPNPNNLNANQYRYGFGGMEQDKQTSSYTTYFRQYDPRIARWKSTDPVTQPWQSPYTAFDNNPIFYTDPSGAIAIPNKRRGIGAGGGIGGIGGALAGSAQTVLSLAIRSGMQASMVGTYMQSAMLPTSSATSSGRELGVGNESGLANNIAANDLYACTTCPQPLNESGGTNVQNTLVLPLGTPVMTPTDGIWESLWHTAYPRTYGMQEVDNLGNVSSGLQPYMGYPPDILGGPLRKGDKAIKLGKTLLNPKAWHNVKRIFLDRVGKTKFDWKVGGNPDLDFKGTKIVLKGRKGTRFEGKSHETDYTINEFIKFLFENGVK